MQAHEIDELNKPGYASHEELKALNEKMDRVIELLNAMNGNLVSIRTNTRPRTGGLVG